MCFYFQLHQPTLHFRRTLMFIDTNCQTNKKQIYQYQFNALNNAIQCHWCKHSNDLHSAISFFKVQNGIYVKLKITFISMTFE